LAQDFDVIIRNGTVYDGTGAEPRQADVAIRAGRGRRPWRFQVSQGENDSSTRKDWWSRPVHQHAFLVHGVADSRWQVAKRDPAGCHDRNHGEGESMGPVNDRVREHMLRAQADIKYDIKWNTLAEYLQYLEKRGISCNVVSFIGATTIREYVIGFEDKPPTPEQLDQMRDLVRKEMEAARWDWHFSIYPPAFYAKTDELIELCKVAAKLPGQIHLAHAQRR